MLRLGSCDWHPQYNAPFFKKQPVEQLNLDACYSTSLEFNTLPTSGMGETLAPSCCWTKTQISHRIVALEGTPCRNLKKRSPVHTETILDTTLLCKCAGRFIAAPLVPPRPIMIGAVVPTMPGGPQVPQTDHPNIWAEIYNGTRTGEVHLLEEEMVASLSFARKPCSSSPTLTIAAAFGGRKLHQKFLSQNSSITCIFALYSGCRAQHGC